MDISKLQDKASYVRLSALENAVRAGKGHLGGTFSCVEILVMLYYGGFLRITPETVNNPDRDYFFIGKGHACLAIYPILYELGFISYNRYMEYGTDGSTLGGQLDITVPGVECNTGSLGHALGLAAGVALASKLDKKKNRAVALLGDAECEEGSVWEAIIFSAEQRLGNLTCIIDRNRLSVTRIMDDSIIFSNFCKKIELFGWKCLVIDGHDLNAISDALEFSGVASKPTMIVANTVKGKGVSFMENITKWHHQVPTETEVALAREELQRVSS
ncbi:MAG: transketolase [Pseudomonadota bacterium]|nr:transketolase [Pseudomonadota bacterium]